MLSQPTPSIRCGGLAISAIALLAAFAPAEAQSPQPKPEPSTQSLESKVACNPGGVAEAATRPETHDAAGTSPGNAGSTGWTGGTGGAHMGTSPQGALPESRTWQPPTARGLDLGMAIPDAPAGKPEGTNKEAC